MEVVEADAWVWFKHPTEMWLPCKVTTGGRDVVMVDQSGTEYRAKAAECYPMHESSLNAVANMVELGDLNEASILHNLRARYNKCARTPHTQPLERRRPRSPAGRMISERLDLPFGAAATRTQAASSATCRSSRTSGRSWSPATPTRRCRSSTRSSSSCITTRCAAAATGRSARRAPSPDEPAGRCPQRYDAGALPPHAYQVTSAAYEQMLAKKHNQSMVISGA